MSERFDWDAATPRDRNAWIAEHIMGRDVMWKENPVGENAPWILERDYFGSGKSAWVEMGGDDDDEWSYSNSAAADYRVLIVVRWDEELRRSFEAHLRKIWMNRSNKDFEWEWTMRYEPGDYSRAAFLTLQETTDAR